MKRQTQLLIITLLAAFSTGCETLSYYRQAVGGHLSLMMSGEDVDELLRDPETNPELKQQLRTANEARRFARERLALPVGDSYTEYVALERPWVLVNLIAAPAFSLEPRTWCYPFVGCQSYRGYYDVSMARSKAEALEAQGYDTFIGGVTAYSTLGWFDDPLHSGFTRLERDRMVALIFHELAHRVLYVDGDTAFNESFATAVELEGLRLWARERADDGAFERALARLRHQKQTLALVEATTRELEQLYSRAGALTEDRLRQRKEAILRQLIEDYNALSRDWDQPGPLGDDPQRLNNANLALFRQYNQHIPAFRQMIEASDHDFEAFYEAARALAQKPREKRERLLRERARRFAEPR